jgi:hypothetical protein
MVCQSPPIRFLTKDVRGAMRQVHRLAVDDVIDAMFGADRVAHRLGLDHPDVAHLEATLKFHDGCAPELIDDTLRVRNRFSGKKRRSKIDKWFQCPSWD